MAPDDDWDLHAVVRGCTTTSTASCSSPTTTTTTTTTMNFVSTGVNVNPSSVFQQDEYFLRLQDLYTRNGGDAVDLFDLYKPFYRKTSPPPPPLSPQSIIPASSLSVYGLQDQNHQNQIFKQKHNNNLSMVGPCTSTTNKASNGSSYLTQKCSRSKRRKNQMKKVIEIPADALSSDMWSWRKYGQKPIKGSPYPRGYYRCSTSKGCLARKQVERNRSDPGMFTVTYTAEHNHPMPTHRNSLAGSSRQKQSGSGSASGSGPVSPPSVGLPVEPEKFEIESCKDEIIEDEMIEDGDENISTVNSVNLEDDFFDGLEEIAAINSAGISNSFSQSMQFPWLTNKATTTAAGGI